MFRCAPWSRRCAPQPRSKPPKEDPDDRAEQAHRPVRGRPDQCPPPARRPAVTTARRRRRPGLGGAWPRAVRAHGRGAARQHAALARRADGGAQRAIRTARRRPEPRPRAARSPAPAPALTAHFLRGDAESCVDLVADALGQRPPVGGSDPADECLVDRGRRGDGDLKLAEPWRPLVPARALAQRRQRPGGLLDIQVPAVPTVPALDGAAIGGRRFPTDDDRRMRPLHRPRALDDVGEADEAPLERRRRLVPQRPHDRQVLVGPGATIGQRHAERAQLRLDIADPDADGQPPLGQHVDRRELLRQQDRLPLRQHDHPEAQPHPAGQRRHVGQGHDRLDTRLVRRIAQTRWQGDVVADPQRLEARLLGQPRPPDHRVRVGAAAPVQPVQPQLQPIRHRSPLSTRLGASYTGGSGSYWMYRRISLARSTPASRASTCKAMSMPAETPAEVTMSPSSTKRSSGRTSMVGSSSASRPRLPRSAWSRRPLAARTGPGRVANATTSASSGWACAHAPKTSHGPTASSSSTSSKSRMPIRCMPVTLSGSGPQWKPSPSSPAEASLEDMVEAQADTVLPVSASQAFEEATDFTRADWLPAVRSLRHVGGPASGVGARYEAEVAVAGQHLHGVLVCEELETPQRAVYRLEGGLDLTIVVEVSPASPGCRLELRVSYKIGGFAGGALERATIGPVRREIVQALANLAGRIEGGPSEP